MDAGGLQFDVLDEGQHALVSSHEAIRRHVCLPGQQPGKRGENVGVSLRTLARPSVRLYSRSGEEGDVHEPRDADHLLLGQDGLHGLLDGVERLQRGNQAPQLLPAPPVKGLIFPVMAAGGQYK